MNLLSKEQKRLWRRSLLWLALLAPFFFLTYGQVNSYTATRQDVGSIVFDWEKAIPFWPWTIVAYWSIDILYGLSLFICHSARELTVHVLRLVAASLLACAGFLLFPLKFSFIRPVSDGLFGWLFEQLDRFDLPYNQAPSLHIILLWLLWLRYYAHTPPRWRWLLHGWFVLIGLSVLTTWQHHFIDLISGLAAGVVVSYLLPIRFTWGWRLTSDQRRVRLAQRYGLGAALSVALAITLGGWGWLLLWPAVSLLAIALGYLGLGVSVFQKDRQGRVSLSARVLLAPYQIGSVCSFFYFRRRTPVINEIVPGIYLGSFPCRPSEANGILDMSSDWPRNRFSLNKAYIACPRLDLVAPSVAELEESVVALETLAVKGSVLVHCALGLSRSAVVVAAWLLKQGYATRVTEAVEALRAVRPNVIIHEGHLHTLSLWQQQYLRGDANA